MANFEAIPVCVDTTWTLWNATVEVNGGYFCCLSGQVGGQSADTIGCSSENVGTAEITTVQSVCILFQHEHYVTMLSTVLQLGQPTPTGSAATFISAIVATGTSTSTSNGGNILSATVGIVTQNSDSRRVEPRPFDIPLTGIISCSFAALSFVGGFLLMLGA
jgi:hypothetical protein